MLALAAGDDGAERDGAGFLTFSFFTLFFSAGMDGCVRGCGGLPPFLFDLHVQILFPTSSFLDAAFLFLSSSSSRNEKRAPLSTRLSTCLSV